MRHGVQSWKMFCFEFFQTVEDQYCSWGEKTQALSMVMPGRFHVLGSFEQWLQGVYRKYSLFAWNALIHFNTLNHMNTICACMQLRALDALSELMLTPFLVTDLMTSWRRQIVFLHSHDWLKCALCTLSCPLEKTDYFEAIPKYYSATSAGDKWKFCLCTMFQVTVTGVFVEKSIWQVLFYFIIGSWIGPGCLTDLAYFV